MDPILSLPEKQGGIWGKAGRAGAADVSPCELAGQQQAPLSCTIQISSLIPPRTSVLILSRPKPVLHVVHHMPVPDYGIYGGEVLVTLQEAV